jgi:hypothetical protein
MRFTRTRLLLLLILCASSLWGQGGINIDTDVEGSRWPAFGTDSGSANAYVVTTVAYVPSLRVGSEIQFFPVASNSGASTLVVNGSSAIPIKKLGSTALASGDIVSGQLVIVDYDGTNFQMVGAGTAAGPATREQMIYATDYGVTGNGRFVWDATLSNGSSTVTCPNSDCNFTSADIGKIIFATNDSPYGYYYQTTSTVVLPQGTITAVGGANSITVSTTATANQTGNAVLVWGSDDSSALASAWAATVAECGSLQLPGQNPSGTGPAVMLVQSAQLNTATASGVGTLATCSIGSEGNRSGLGIRGVDQNATFIVPTPSFNFSSCTYGHSAKACFFTVADGLNISNLTLWGAGYSNPSSASTNVIWEVNPIAAINSATSGNESLERVTIMGWGAGSAGIGTGILFDGGTVLTNQVTSDGAGEVGCKVVGPQTFWNLVCFDNYKGNLWVASTYPVVSHAGVYGTVTKNDNTVGIISVTGSGAFYSFGDTIGDTLGPYEFNGVMVGLAPGGGTSTGSSAYLFGSTLDIGTSPSGAAAYTVSGNTIYASASYFHGAGSSGYGVYNSGVFNDLGGNTFAGTTAFFGNAVQTDFRVPGADYVLLSTAANVEQWKQINGGSSCGDGTHAVNYTPGTGFGCQSLTGGASGGANVQTTSYTLTSGDSGKLVVMNCSSACTVTLYGSPTSTYAASIVSIGSTTATVSLNSLNFNGAASVPVLIKYRPVSLWSDGSNYFGTAPEAAGSNVTITPTSNAETYAATSSGGSGGGVNVQTSSYTLVSGDAGKLVIMNCSSACTVTMYGSPSSTFWGAIVTIGSSTATVSLNSLNFNGFSTVPVLNNYQPLTFWSDGANYFGNGGLIAGSNVTFTPASQGMTIAATAGSGSGSLILVESHTASSSASLNFTSCISSTYDDYQIELINVLPATNTTAPWLRMSTNGGSSYDSGTNYASWYRYTGTSAGDSGGAAQTEVILFGNIANAGAGISGTVKLYNPNQSSVQKPVQFDLVNAQTSNTFRAMGGGQYTVTGSSVNAFQFLFSSGNIASGTIRCYGIAH